MNDDKRQTIILTNRPPVTIREADWPTIASAYDDNRVSDWYLGVQQHADGRAIVYARYDHTTRAASRDVQAYAGLLLPDGDTKMIVDAIHTVTETIAAAEHEGTDADRWPTLRDACIANLPAEVLA